MGDEEDRKLFVGGLPQEASQDDLQVFVCVCVCVCVCASEYADIFKLLCVSFLRNILVNLGSWTL